MLDVGEDELLGRALGMLGGSAGGAAGARFMAKLLKKNVREVELVLPLELNAAFEQVRAALGQLGEEVAAPEVHDDAHATVVRVVADGGFGGLNPVVVTAVVASAGPGEARVLLRGAAKEGLIKQRAGEKAVERVRTLLSA
jgi:hypothetical protein